MFWRNSFLPLFLCCSLPAPTQTLVPRLSSCQIPAKARNAGEGLTEAQLPFRQCRAHTFAGCLMMAYSWKKQIFAQKSCLPATAKRTSWVCGGGDNWKRAWGSSKKRRAEINGGLGCKETGDPVRSEHRREENLLYRGERHMLRGHQKKKVQKNHWWEDKRMKISEDWNKFWRV